MPPLLQLLHQAMTSSERSPSFPNRFQASNSAVIIFRAVEPGEAAALRCRHHRHPTAESGHPGRHYHRRLDSPGRQRRPGATERLATASETMFLHRGPRPEDASVEAYGEAGESKKDIACGSGHIGDRFSTWRLSCDH